MITMDHYKDDYFKFRDKIKYLLKNQEIRLIEELRVVENAIGTFISNGHGFVIRKRK